jgi:hypothetical protein
MAERFELVEDDEGREGYVTLDRSGTWRVQAWWFPAAGSIGGPHELHVTPAEDADPVRVARGITTATLNALPMVAMTSEHAKGEDVVFGRPLLRVLRRDAARRNRPREFYLLVARHYADLVQAGARRPVQLIAERARVSESAVRGWLRVAREMGYLTGERGRTAGELTPSAMELLPELWRYAGVEMQ